MAHNWEDTAVRARREPLPRGQLVYVTAFPPKATDPSADQRTEALRLQGELRMALDEAKVLADVRLSTASQELTAYIHTSDADAAFAAMHPILAASGLCANGFALLRYGEAGTPDRRITLSPAAPR